MHEYVLLQAVDGVLRDFSLPPFYYPPSFHVSLGWCLGNKIKEINKILPALGTQTDIDKNNWNTNSHR